MMNSNRPTGDYSVLSSGLVVLLLVLVIIMAATGKSFATAPGGSVLHTTIFAVVAAVACILAFTDPTTINVFGLCAVIVGFIAMLVGTAMIRSTRH